MYKADFYITQAAPEDSGKKYTFTKLSGWGELLEAPGGELIEIRLDKRPEGWRVSEEKTGLLISSQAFRTRTDAVKALRPELLRRIAEELQKPFAVDLANTLTDFIMKQ